MSSSEIKVKEKLAPDCSVIRFQDIAENISKRIDPKETKLGIYIGLEHIEPGSLKIRQYGKPEDVKGVKLIAKPGDIIFGKRRAYQGKVAVCEHDAIVSAHSMVLREKEENIVSGLLPYFMQSEQFYNTSIKISEGSLSPTIKWKVLAEETFHFPNMEVQKNILKVLTSIEHLLYEQEELVNKTKIFKEKILNKLFSQGVSHKALKDSIIGDIPEHWDLKKLGEVTDVRDGTHDSPKYVLNGVPFITSKNLKPDGVIDFSDINYISEKDHLKIEKRSGVNNGDILFGMIGTIGNPVIVKKEFDFSIKNVALIKFESSKDIKNKFVYYYLQSKHIKKQFSKQTNGGVQKFISLNTIRNLAIPIPTLEEQNEIIDILENVDKTIFDTIAHIDDTKKLKKKLLNKLFSPIKSMEK